ncbi:exosortase/archaeosortase family protein [Synechococcus sp. CS-1325]|uniref:exosortase/archaeosortase family protein n=1 Tax=Synechococcus sp. CS-1325 TaxID=2847979 RepID=UPI000DB0AC65|nr:exosortase/archaeosortase family protein [Synechococcus sp. CS-1325]MCT0198960.1 exosortase/archaeosortase family protein [Synechococcus sp. CS-1325]PZU99081.1 MAG: hypothetical protein DCF24_09815 [Cyanobium sp.]
MRAAFSLSTVLSLSPSRRNLWLLLAGFVAFQHLLVIHQTQESPILLTLAFLVWWGAWLCSEDQIAIVEPRPGRIGLFFGSLIVVLCILRGGNTFYSDGLIIALMAPALGFALSMLYLPLHYLRRFSASLFILTLLPLQIVIYRLVPEQIVSLVTASTSGLLLKGIGKDVAVEGRHVLLPGGGVIVHGPCNGTDIFSMLLVVALIFLVAFPLRRGLHQLLVIALTPIAALICNSARISILALLAATPSTRSDWLFDFFHENEGSLIFSGIAVSLLATLYFALLNQELSPNDQTKH